MIGFLRRNRWWLGRLAVLPLQMLGFAVVAFFLVRTIPGDPVLVVTGSQVGPEEYARMKEEMGLAGSLWEQLVNYLQSLATLDLGSSLITGRTVLSEFRERLPATLELALMGQAGTILLAVVAAYVGAVHPRSFGARIVRWYARTAGAIPEFALGVAMIFLFYATLHWAPAPFGRVGTDIPNPTQVTGFPFLDTLLTGEFAATRSMAAHLVLPVIVMIISHTGVLTKLLIADLEDSLDSPPTRFRIASGAPRHMIVLSVFRRALPPSVTMAGSVFGYLIGGAVILEALFGLGGMGQYLVDAVNVSDITALQAFLVVVAAISLVIYLLIDLTNMWLDARRRPGVRVEAGV